MLEADQLVLVVEDEPALRKFVRATLLAHGYRVVEAASVREALQLATGHNPDLILLDLGLPDGDGLALTEQIRGWSRVPIVVVSARGREADKVAALDAGADDYLTKPFGVAELLARLRVALRHAAAARAPELPPVQALGAVSLDRVRREVKKAGELLHLTPTEYRLLLLLADHVGKVVTHKQILREVWGPGAMDQSHYVRVHMAELRKKVEDEPARPKLLLTEPGVGYRLRDDPA